MEKFKLIAFVTISTYTTVEAESLEEAIKIAEDRPMMAIVDNGHDTEYDSWMTDELDGEPVDIRQDDV